MDTQKITFRNYLPSTLTLILVGSGGLAAILYFSVPLVWARWGFFLFGIMALTGLSMPVVYFFNQRFPSNPQAESNVIVRQAIWAGVYFATLAWLQLGRLVTLYVIFGLAVGIVAIEYFIRIREKANWKKPAIPDDNAS